MRSRRAVNMLLRNLCTAARPPRHRPTGERLIVVLDMDECLIHSTDFSMEPEDGFRQTENRPDQVREAPTADQFKLVMADGASCMVLKRPGVDQFLEACAAEFDTYVFTAGTQPYAEPLLDLLDPSKTLIKDRFYRHDCRRVRVPGTSSIQFLKDLSAVTENMSRLCEWWEALTLFAAAKRHLSSRLCWKA
eukprot:TRINITY_DN7102_c0_g1_i4.p1 TRINITY_DN7102_c0_g1~~TRINITY_DN7102_c0_g1_i4.p1  ORF type:complete len:191 (-),score=13.18 TRINITY_DN7102_c0_g1_i4:456-1028(-)